MRHCKKLALTLLFSLCAYSGFSRTFTNIWGGEGYSLHNNYDLGVSYGLNFYKAISKGVGLGFSIFVQQYNVNTRQDLNSVTGGEIGMNAKYAYFAPIVVAQLGRSGHYSGYFNAGIGILQDGYTNVHTWSNVQWPVGSAYDNTVKSKDYLATMGFRLGIGLIQYSHLAGSFHVFISEDIGITPASLQSSTDLPNQDNFKNNLNSFFSPMYFSLRVGIAHITNSNPKKRRY